MEEQEFDLIILEIRFKETAAFSLLTTILERNSHQKALVFTMYPEIIMEQRIRGLGGVGYLNKTADSTEILSAVKAILSDHAYDQIVSNYTQSLEEGTDSPFDALSARELEICILLLEGNSSKEITEIMQLKPSTVATHKNRMLKKLNVPNLLTLNRLAIHWGLI